MAKTWVLETSTKGTGANIVPLDDEQDPPEREKPAREKLWVHAPTVEREKPPPEPRKPRRFRVVEITTHRTLADDADARTTVAALREVHSVVDVAISVWSEKDGRYRLLTHGEQRQLWDLRFAGTGGAGQAASAQP